MEELFSSSRRSCRSPECGHLSDGVSLLDRPPQQKQPLDLFLGIDAPAAGPLRNDRAGIAAPMHATCPGESL